MKQKEYIEEIDPIDLGIMWDRLVSITDAILSAMIRTSFSILVREVKDIGCAILDAEARAIAFAPKAVPGFNASAQYTLAAMLEKYPAETLKPGDVIASNDPWTGAGHRPDIAIMRPVFNADKVVAYLMTYSHLPDIGGVMNVIQAVDNYEEGFALPVVKLFKAGKKNEELFELLAVNVRDEDQVIGDVMASVAGTGVGAELVLEFLDDYNLNNLQSVAEGILRQTEQAMRDRIRTIPDGVYKHELTGEGVVDDIVYSCTVTVDGDSIDVDFTGTGPSVPFAINCTENNMKSAVCEAIKSITTPSIPGNQGDTMAITASAPSGCILNAPHPAATFSRYMSAFNIPGLIFNALSEAIPERVMADVGMGNAFILYGVDKNGRSVTTHYITAGGLGALQGRDGQQTIPYPVNSSLIASELWEIETGLKILKRELRTDSGGPGEYRGGAGQIIEMLNTNDTAFTIVCFAVRTKRPAAGIAGGGQGQLRYMEIDDKEIAGTGAHQLPPGGIFRMNEAGGGGFGDPANRAPEKVLQDVLGGFVSVEGALRDYGVTVDLDNNSAQRI